MKNNIFSSLLITIAIFGSGTSCNSQGNPSPGSKTADKTKTAPAKFTEGKDYTEFVRARIMDKVGFGQPVEAFSILIPKNWKFDGAIMWTAPGNTCAGTNQGVKAVSPDGKYSFEMLPNYMWSYTDNQQLQQFNQQYGNSQYCSQGQPINAEAYFRNVFAPNDLNNPEIISINENAGGSQVLQESNEKARQELMRYGASQVNFYPSSIYAKVKWTNGSHAIVICGVNIIETFIPNTYTGTYNKSYTTVASERIVFMYPESETDKAPNLLSVIMASFRTNYAWKNAVDNFWLEVRQQRQIVHVGKIRMMDEQTRQMGEDAIKKGDQNLKNMDANMRSWEASQQSQDRVHTNFIKTIREVENYRDETGKIELSSGYNHAWSRSDGSSFIMSDNPNFDPSSVFQDNRWKEMKKVQ